MQKFGRLSDEVKSQVLAKRRTFEGEKREGWLKIPKPLEGLLWLFLLNLFFFGCGRSLKEAVFKSEAKEDFKGVLTIVDVADPRQPKIVSSTSIPWRTKASNLDAVDHVVVWKQHVLLTSHYGVHLLDVENPQKPRLLWNRPLTTSIRKVAVFEDYALFATEEGLYILQLKNPLQPQWVFRAGKEEYLNAPLLDLKIKGKYAYALDTYRYLHILDLSKPAKPKIVALTLSPGLLYFFSEL